ncbi:hypothetical protein BDZ97DRAFT_1844850 [Flammula alnicola]|nr:hypothetical protein BDZ97DRAFT_1844850 [Flammula alnicola]
MRQGDGFDLSQVSWKAFSKEAMFDRRWYLRRERLGMAAQCAATYCMFKYKFLRNHIQEFSLHVAHVHDSDIEAATILGMIFPCFVTLLFNAEYFLLLFWPAKTYPKWYINAKKWTFVGITFGMVATVIIGTVIVARRSASITGVDMATAQQLTTLYFRPPLSPYFTFRIYSLSNVTEQSIIRGHRTSHGLFCSGLLLL